MNLLKCPPLKTASKKAKIFVKMQILVNKKIENHPCYLLRSLAKIKVSGK